MFSQIIMAMLGLAIPPALAIVVLERIRRPQDIWRRPEVGIIFGFMIDAVRRISILATGVSISLRWYWSVAGVISLGTICVALWARVIQVVRHRVRNREMRERAAAELERLGQHVPR